MKAKPDLVAVWEQLGGAVQALRPSGWTPAKCPLHQDRQASAQVNELEQTFRCHVCDVFGDVYELVMKAEGISFRGSVRRAAELSGDSPEVQRKPRLRHPGAPGRPGNLAGGSGFVPPWLRDRSGTGT